MPATRPRRCRRGRTRPPSRPSRTWKPGSATTVPGALCPYSERMSDRASRIASWLSERAHAAGARGYVVGLSGGVDSAVVARLCQMAAHNHVMGVLLPCYSQPQDEEDALLVAKTFKLPHVRVDLASTFDALQGSLHDAVKGLPHEVHVIDIKQQLPEANIKPRLRMTTL